MKEDCFICKSTNNISLLSPFLSKQIKLILNTKQSEYSICVLCEHNIKLVCEVHKELKNINLNCRLQNKCIFCKNQQYLLNVYDEENKGGSFIDKFRKCYNNNINFRRKWVCYKCIYIIDIWWTLKNSYNKTLLHSSNKRKSESELKKLQMDICNVDTFYGLDRKRKKRNSTSTDLDVCNIFHKETATDIVKRLSLNSPRKINNDNKFSKKVCLVICNKNNIEENENKNVYSKTVERKTLKRVKFKESTEIIEIYSDDSQDKPTSKKTKKSQPKKSMFKVDNVKETVNDVETKNNEEENNEDVVNKNNIVTITKEELAVNEESSNILQNVSIDNECSSQKIELKNDTENMLNENLENKNETIDTISNKNESTIAVDKNKLEFELEKIANEADKQKLNVQKEKKECENNALENQHLKNSENTQENIKETDTVTEENENKANSVVDIKNKDNSDVGDENKEVENENNSEVENKTKETKEDNEKLTKNLPAQDTLCQEAEITFREQPINSNNSENIQENIKNTYSCEIAEENENIASSEVDNEKKDNSEVENEKEKLVDNEKLIKNLSVQKNADDILCKEREITSREHPINSNDFEENIKNTDSTEIIEKNENNDNSEIENETQEINNDEKLTKSLSVQKIVDDTLCKEVGENDNKDNSEVENEIQEIKADKKLTENLSLCKEVEVASTEQSLIEDVDKIVNNLIIDENNKHEKEREFKSVVHILENLDA